tara:strand:+ start:622 stop:1755 length:1134 start_codon:yes stop_codon:yes gene_type:complete
VDQIRGMFDIKTTSEASETFEVELPNVDELINNKPWQLGVIVGPSGSGKTTVAGDVFGKCLYTSNNWDHNRSPVEQFDGTDVKILTSVLNAVGFSSPPSWIKPYGVLSGGEKFRCDLAHALLCGDQSLVVFDEFTSVVDRTVAKIGSAAIAKSIRSGRINKKFVAVTCHYDVLDWLEPDWVLDMASGELARGRLRQRPEIKLEVAPVHYSSWDVFRRHHYLNTSIMKGSHCYMATWNGEPVAFSSWTHRMARGGCKGDMREHRTIVLPDFQGVGIGNRLSELCASIWTGLGRRAYSTTSHPAMIYFRRKSSSWKMIRHGMTSPSGRTGVLRVNATSEGTSTGRITGGFQYIGPPMKYEQAKNLIDNKPTSLKKAAKQ